MPKNDRLLEFLRGYKCPNSYQLPTMTLICSICHRKRKVTPIRMKHREKGHSMVIHLCPDCYKAVKADQKQLYPKEFTYEETINS
jgi:hypothetical protein